MYILNFNFLTQFGAKIEDEQHFFEVKKGEGNFISSLLIDLEG